MDSVVLDGELGAGDVFLVQFRQGFLNSLRDPALLLAQQPSSLRTSFRAFCIMRIQINESVIYTAKGERDSSSGKGRFLA